MVACINIYTESLRQPSENYHIVNQSILSNKQKSLIKICPAKNLPCKQRKE